MTKTKLQQAKELVKGCGNWAEDTLVQCRFECGYIDKRGVKHFCNSCKSKAETTKNCWKEELEFLEDSWFSTTYKCPKNIREFVENEKNELKEAIDLLEENGI